MTAQRSSARADADRARQQATDRQTITNTCQELAALWPQLNHALAHDMAASGDSPVNRSNRAVTSTLVNHDVARALTEVNRWLATLRSELVPLLRLDAWPQSIPAVARTVPAWHQQLQHMNLPTAKYLLADAEHALGSARRALGLHTRDRATGGLCPDCPITLTVVNGKPQIVGSPLYWLGKDATLDDAIITSPAGRTTWRIPTGAITWTRADTVRCPHCGQTWKGLAELNILARRLKEQRHD